MMLRTLARPQTTQRLTRALHATAPTHRIYDSILDTVGDTPIVRLNNIVPRDDVTVYAKCEYFNPLHSVKDRLALGIIEDAEQSLSLIHISEPTRLLSISYAVFCLKKKKKHQPHTHAKFTITNIQSITRI
eukprot:TRINITY_DN17072_c0_g1_i3.p2 TRINITY_DN17072_c0_g1~~TRINITY_DN17072_c0_g1_i3.p2  ORF type:complete len:131 (+),score=20.20 TRINITY_DN17072_c0_g1_i3:238-630(+)